jgi:hypothetical protein
MPTPTKAEQYLGPIHMVPVEFVDALLAALGNPPEAGQALDVATNKLQVDPYTAADMLNVSNRYMLQAIDNGEVPAASNPDERVQRVRLSDVLKHARAMHNEAANELTRMDQELSPNDE